MAKQIALVTGASSGIGAEFARQLAARGCDLVLTARREERLRALGEELAARYGAACEVLAADLSAEAGITAVEARLHRGDVHLLVNSAGLSIVKPFAQADLAGQAAMLTVHMVAPMRLTHVALPGMRARRSGGVINVASLLAFVSLPKNANYSATKAYLMRFSRAVHAEVRREGVTVQALCPGLTATELHGREERAQLQRRAPPFMWASAEAVVHDSLRAFDCREALCVPGAINRAIYWVCKLGVPDALAPFVIR
jgi:short-subunit dehydrogenase